jgi:hypothetical protein
MTAPSSQSNVKSENVERVVSICVELRDYLDRAKRQADEEIRTYPTPIPRCDAQFNYLYEQRSRLSQFLERVNAALAHDDGIGELANTLADFVTRPPFTDSVMELQLRERLSAELARPNPAFDADPDRRAFGRDGGAG